MIRRMDNRWPGAVLFSILLAAAGLGCQLPVIDMNAPGARHVVIIGVDGMSPDGIRKAHTPTLDALMARGAWTLNARAVMPTSSSPNWASMIMGAGPEQHGITSNAWEPDEFELAPTARGMGAIFPTIFGVLRTQRPRAVIACFHDWGGFGRLMEREALDVIEDTPGPKATTERAAAVILTMKPDFMFVHLDHVDHVGHDKGHGTPQYYASVEQADAYIGQLLAAIEEAGIAEETIVIVTSDHGGKGKGHGGATLAEIEIPWIIAGPGIREGHELSGPVNTYDTAATAAYIFQLRPPRAWIAKPITEAFK